MVLSHFTPSWFQGYDILLEFLFAIVSLTVGIFSYKIYLKVKKENVKFFSFAFLLISLSYFIQTIFNYLVYSSINEGICCMIEISNINYYENLAVMVHMFFMTIGLAMLLYTTFKEEKRRLLLLFILMPLLIIFSFDSLYLFYLISSIYLGFISWNYIVNFIKNKKYNTLLVAIAFLFLFFGSFHFLIAVNHEIYYVIGLILELLAYLFILFNLYSIKRK